MNAWQLYLLSQEDQNSNLSFYYDEAYKCWHSVWSEALQELDGKNNLHSDDFLRQECISTIFNSTECVGMALFHKLNFERKAPWKDSYFQAWPLKSLENLCRDSSDILVASYVTVAKKYRGVFEGLSIKNLISELGVQLLLSSDCSVMSGTMRNNRGMNKVAYTTGATLIQENVEFHGVNVDLVGYYKKNIVSNGLQSSFTAQSLWKNRKIISPSVLTGMPIRKVA